MRYGIGTTIAIRQSMATVKATRARIVEAWHRRNPGGDLGVDCLRVPELAAWLRIQEDKAFKAVDSLIKDGHIEDRGEMGLRRRSTETPLPDAVETACIDVAIANRRRMVLLNDPEALALRNAISKELGDRAPVWQRRSLREAVRNKLAKCGLEQLIPT